MTALDLGPLYLQHIPLDLLLHLLQHAPDTTKEEKDHHSALAAVNDPEVQMTVQKFLEAHYPALPQAVVQSWTLRRPGVVHLFELPGIDQMSIEKVKAATVQGLSDGDPETIGRFDQRDNGPGFLEGVITYSVPFSYRRDGDDIDDARDAPVGVRMRFVSDGGVSTGALLEAYGAQGLCTRAAVSILEAVLDAKLPRGKKRLQYLRPVVFSESQIRSLASKKGMPWIGTAGSDPTGEAHWEAFKGRKVGVHHQPLNMAAAKLKAHQSHKNEAGTYYRDVQHANGWVERVTVTYHYKAKHPAVRFDVRHTRFAADLILSELHDSL